MKQIVVETVVKEVNEGIENIVDKSQFVAEVKDTINKTETYILPDHELSFSPFQGGKGARSVRIKSDLPIKMSYTSQNNSYDFGCYVKEILLLGDNEDENVTAFYIAKYGSITLKNRDMEKTAHITMIYAY